MVWWKHLSSLTTFLRLAAMVLYQKKLILNFASPADFTEISDDWHILQETSSKIQLEDVSGGNGGTDLLTFEKI
jgi:hypothetical protein